MKRLFKKLFDMTFLIYVALGFLNYGFCSAVMLFFKHELGVPDVPCMYISFFLQTTISFFLNRYVTFRGLEISRYWPVYVVISVASCVVIARVLLKKLLEYLITLPFFISIADWVQSVFFAITKKQIAPANFRDDLILLTCTFTYSVINYIGQRYFVFKPRKRDREYPPIPADRTDGGSDPDPRSAPEST